MGKKKVPYTPDPDCPNCGGLHFGSTRCPYAVPYDADDSLGVKRGLQHTAGTVLIRRSHK